jgi:hypothetical protein
VLFRQNLRVGRYVTTSGLGLKVAPPFRRRLIPLFAWPFALGLCGLTAHTVARTIAGPGPGSALERLHDFFWVAFPSTLVPFAALAIWLVWAVAALLYNRRVFPARYAAWRRQWLCLDCGATVVGPTAAE